MVIIHHLESVISGMNVVDKINSQPVDKRETPINNIKIKIELIKIGNQ